MFNSCPDGEKSVCINGDDWEDMQEVGLHCWWDDGIYRWWVTGG